MSVILLTSIAIRLVATVWSVVLWRGVRDWRMGFLTVMLALMATRQVLTLIQNATSLGLTLNVEAHGDELPGLVVSVMAFLAVFSLERILRERSRAEEERARLAHRIRQQQKLEAIGTLASGVAHEINNPVQGIMNYAELIKRRAGDNLEIRRYAQEIVQESGRAAAIVRSLLTFARQEKPQYRAQSIGEIVEGTLSLMRSLLAKDRIELFLDIPADLPEVMCHKQQIQQVLMNLVTNARDAVNERFPDHDDRKLISIRARAAVEGDRSGVRLTVEDNGSGVPAELASRLFDPFFTTKMGEAGTGLGLSVSHGIATDHGGELSFESAPDEPTRFHLDLPAA